MCTRLIHNFNQVLADVYVILTSATGLPAPPNPATALPDGDCDLTTLVEIMRYAPPANFTRHPAISFPARYSAAGLPIGMQAIGRQWQEATLLQLALAAERVVEHRQPQIFYLVIGTNRTRSPTISTADRVKGEAFLK